MEHLGWLSNLIKALAAPMKVTAERVALWAERRKPNCTSISIWPLWSGVSGISSKCRTIVLLLVALGLQANPARTQGKGKSVEPPSQPAELNRHGAEAMGFNQQKITHHFRLLRDGGLIRVEANDEKDTDTVARIRKHLKEQATKFSQGDFSAPVHTHGEVPPGVPAMVKLSQKIQYQYKSRPRGGELRISSADPEAVAAVHEFLKYQQAQHHTGDSTHVH